MYLFTSESAIVAHEYLLLQSMRFNALRIGEHFWNLGTKPQRNTSFLSYHTVSDITSQALIWTPCPQPNRWAGVGQKMIPESLGKNLWNQCFCPVRGHMLGCRPQIEITVYVSKLQ